MDAAYRLIYAFFESPAAGQCLLASEPSLAKARTGLGETPLHYLTVENQLEAVLILVNNGSEVNTINHCGGTPLSEAAGLGYTKLVKYLLSVNAKIVFDGQDEPTLIKATHSGKFEIVQMLLNAGADINIKNDLDETPLHIAAQRNDLEMVRMLVRAGADINAQRIFDETPLDVARNSGAAAVEAELTRLSNH